MSPQNQRKKKRWRWDIVKQSVVNSVGKVMGKGGVLVIFSFFIYMYLHIIYTLILTHVLFFICEREHEEVGRRRGGERES